MEDISFNLIDEPWIPCVDLEGGQQTLGIKDLLMQSHKLRAVTHQNPLAEAALLRVLLALIHSAIKGPKDKGEWKRLYQEGKFDAQIFQYLDNQHDCFDLFSKEKPFYQTPGLMVIRNEKPAPQSIRSLMMERASGNNKTLFDHTTSDIQVRLSPAEAVQTLITAQMFSLSGTNKKTTNLFGYQGNFSYASMVSGIFIVLSGGCLFETLILNLLIYKDNEPIPNNPDDCPVWERSDIGGDKVTTPKGYLDYLTSKSRHILLVPRKENNSIFVEHMHIAQGEFFSEVLNPLSFRKQKKDGNWHHPNMDVERLVWRDSISLFSFDENTDHRPMTFRQIQRMQKIVPLPDRFMCMAYGMLNDQANILSWRKDKMNVPLTLLSDRTVVAYLKKAMTFSEKGNHTLNNSVRSFMREYLPENTKKDKINSKAAATGAMRTYWDRLEGHFQAFLLDLDDPEMALTVWEDALKQAARDAFILCIGTRYRDSARFHNAYTKAYAYLNAGLAKFQG